MASKNLQLPKRPISIFDPVFWYRLFNTWRRNQTKEYVRAKELIRIIQEYGREYSKGRTPRVDITDRRNRQSYIILSDKPVYRSLEQSVIMDLDRHNNIVGIEISGLLPAEPKPPMTKIVKDINEAYEKAESRK